MSICALEDCFENIDNWRGIRTCDWVAAAGGGLFSGAKPQTKTKIWDKWRTRSAGMAAANNTLRRRRSGGHKAGTRRHKAHKWRGAAEGNNTRRTSGEQKDQLQRGGQRISRPAFFEERRKL